MADNDQKRPTSIKFIYKYSGGYRIIHATGVYGGVTPRGIKFDFFTEYRSLPQEEIRQVKEDGTIGDLVDTVQSIGTLEVTRELQVGVIINAEDAESIARWLLDKVKEYKALKSE